MITYVLMGFIVIVIAIATLWNCKYELTKDVFMSKDDSDFLRGFWCLIVILVHVPTVYQNRIQDMIGSFAFVGVTFFFMTSAYGLKYSMIHKPGYMKTFWRRRLPTILIPALIANAFSVIVRGIDGEGITVISFINIDNWVKVLLLYYLVFWLIYYVAPKTVRGGYWQDLLMCLIVVVFSLIDKFTSFHITQGWIVEPIGFVYGIILANSNAGVKDWLQRKWIVKCIAFAILSGVLGLAYLKFKTIVFWGDYLLKIFLGITITAFIFEIITKIRVGNKLNGFLGSISYEVYILHRSVFVLAGILLGTVVLVYSLSAQSLYRYC